MKKVLITMALLASMVAGAMVLSSFAAPKQNVKENSSDIVLNDDGWEDYTSGITAMCYSKRQGQWVHTGSARNNCYVQRRSWCGKPEYRIKEGNQKKWFAVSESPVDGYKYCFYDGSNAYCFNM